MADTASGVAGLVTGTVCGKGVVGATGATGAVVLRYAVEFAAGAGTGIGVVAGGAGAGVEAGGAGAGVAVESVNGQYTVVWVTMLSEVTV